MSRNEMTLNSRTSGSGQRRARTLIGISLAAAFLSVLPSWAQTVVRQPYLQLQTPTSMTLVWRTDTATDSRVRYGTVQGSLTQTATNPANVTNHIVTITGLAPATKYFYDAGSTTTVQAGGTSEHYFVTSPTVGTVTPFRAWIVGDSGTGGSEQAAVRDAMLAYTGANRPQMMLHVGDIAYTSGSEQEFTDFHFGMYPNIFRHTVQWPTLGNHEGASTTSGQPGSSTGPYYDAYVLPTAAEAGGTASGTEAYYSFDYGNVHFISLNAYQVSRSATGPMAIWLQNDLAATNAQWVVAFWHHPPYTHGTHNSDSETELREMRQNLVPILEAGGVDLVLCGHSHDYERSYLIDGTYSTPTPNFATLEAQGHILDDGDGKPTGDGAYQKGAGLNAHEGAVYVVAGHGGAGMGGTLDHPVMYFSEAVHGSCILDVDGNSLTLTNVRVSGVVSDTFTIQKGPQAPKVLSTSPTKSAVIASLPTVRVTFSTNVTGVDAGDLSVNGSAATTLSGASGGSVYDFGGFAVPANGHVGVVLAAGGIADASNGSLVFTGNTWSYTIDTTPPRVFSESPARSQAIGVLPSVTVNFTKPVTGVVAGSLQVNGQPATTLSGISGSTGPYTFTGFPAPTIGQVSVSLLAGAIKDELLQPFGGDSWVYVLQPHLVVNEYLTSNNTSATDENGEHDDYVEIYNPANVAVDMSGMHLSDTLDFPAQYQIPAGTVIPAHGHLVFWCDSQPAQGPFHTNFNLARAGESVGLFDTDENGFATIDATSWVNGTTDVAVGRFPDGAPGFVNMPDTAGATNTIACTTSPQCSALADQCNTGVCTANRCVAAPANQGAACDDGIACRAPDTCSAGVCDGGPSLCTGGQTCNLVTGLCEMPAADPLPIGVGAPWKYFKGTVAPPATWNEIAFDDSGWTTGNSGFGYGPDCSAERGTPELTDMANTYASLYVRRTFRVDNPAAIQSMTALMDYDDGFVLYINGHEVARSNVVGTPPSNTQLATADHECSTCNGTTCNAPEAFPINLSTAQLVAGNNVIAIQGHNTTLASTDFTLVPTLVATEGQGCAVNPECDDNNPCTDDACAGGACQHTNSDTNVCSDGVACTNDVCSGGSCLSTSACPVGRTCNLGSGSCDATPVTVSFQQGVSTYNGAADTYIHAGAPTTDNGAAATLIVDGPGTVPADERQTLIRFDAMFTSQGGPIPDGATISSASLQLNITNASADGADLHRMLVPWTAASTWNSLTNGVQRDGVESVAVRDVTSLWNGALPHLQLIDVTSSVAAWSAGGVKQGWVLVTPPPGSDSWQFDSAEGATIANRPRLSVTYTFSPPCGVDADCTDNNLCNGIETCVATVCQPGTALVCNDGNGCTSDSCNPVSGCVFANNTNPCSDGNACTTNDACVGGACVSGAAANCDDANACTDDSCNTVSGCVHLNNTASCSDGNLCTTGDVCSSGTCGGTAVSCPVGQTCNAGTGTCQSGPTTLSFQQGLAGYTGTVDTYIDSALGSQAAVSPIVIDGSPVEQVLLRFDGIFGAGANQIPAGSTVSSATLTLWVGANTSDESTDTVNFHRLLHAWNATDVWSAYGVAPWNAQPGVQNDGADALAAPAATATMTTLATAYPVDVTTSLAAWSAAPTGNFGWVILPPAAGTNGLRLESAESTTASNARRPLLSVTFNPPATGCTVNADCNDNNVCNGIETCVANVCQAGTALVCADANVCTTDSCNPVGGCVFANNTVACSDGNACTTADTCAGGACVGGAAPNCDDSNPCTNDSCNTGSGCVHANNTASCSDGSLCTTGDVCSGGTCGGTAVSCPVGQTCNPGTGVCQSGPSTVSFQQGASGYSGSADTYIDTLLGSQAGAALIVIDGDPSVEQALLRFDGIFGSGAGQIPAGSTISSATLTLWVGAATNDPSPNAVNFHRLLHAWTDTGVWADYGVAPWNASAGVQIDGVDALAATAATATMATAATSYPVDVTTSLQAWAAAPSSNFGWAILPTGTDGLRLESNESTTASNTRRPLLSVTFNPPATGCTVNGDCNDNNVCNGVETCVANVCQAGTALNCDDSIVCTTDSCNAITGCAHANNTIACNDGNACTTTDTCAGGVCVGGAAPNCDDSNPCTNDSCNTGTGCVHANNTASCSDGNLCTTGDVCGGGTCGGTAVSCSVGQTCNPTNGLCESGTVPPLPIAIGATWKYFKGTVEPPATWAAIAFDDTTWLSGPSGFGYGDSDDATVLSDMQNPPNTPGYVSVYVRKQFSVSNAASVTGLTLTVDYDDGYVAYLNGTLVKSTNMANGVAFNALASAGHEASAGASGLPPEVTSLNSFLGLLVSGTNVLAIHGANVTLDSSDLSLIPSLTATFAGCTVNGDCTDNNVCNGIETCVANACQPGTALNCDDSNVCTTDSCNATLGCQHVNNTVACNDGLTCTTADACSGGSCAGTPVSCDDGVACTTDTCLEGSGCQHVSGCPGGGSCNTQTGVCTAALMECSPSTIPAGSGSTANLTVVLRNLGGLAPVRGYQTQISIARTGGTGTVSVGCPGGVAIDDVRPDYVFAGAGLDFPATNCTLRRASSSLLSGGVTVGPTPAYLSSYTLTTSADATAGSTFTISLDAPAASSVVGTSGQAIDFDRGPACTLTIASCGTAADCNDGNPCTVDSCDLALGCQHTPGNSGAVCRPSAGACDQAETCTGASAVCPSDQASPNGTACSDGNACNGLETCQSGACTAGTPLTCNDSNPCTDDACNSLSGLCVFTPNDTNVCADADICTADACSGGTCVHTPSGVCGVSGTVRYYRDDTANGGTGVEPSAKPVPNVGIDGTQDAVADATTGSSGTYALGNLFGNVTLTTTSKYGSPRASDHNNAVSSFDASVVARAGALLVTLTPNQRIAADVTGDGTVGAFDASFVARFAASLIDHFDVAIATGSDWTFRRCDAYAFPGDPGCGSPSYAFTPISQAESGKDFYAILYGDVTGNWLPAAPFASMAERVVPSPDEKDAMAADQPAGNAPTTDAVRNPSSPPAEVSIDRLTTPLRKGERRQLTIRLENADAILGLDLNLRYDTSRIKVVGVQPTGIATGWGLAHSDQPGFHRITTYGVQPLVGSGTAVIVTVEGIGDGGRATPIQIDGVANEGTIPLHPRAGVGRPGVDVLENPSVDRW